MLFVSHCQISHLSDAEMASFYWHSPRKLVETEQYFEQSASLLAVDCWTKLCQTWLQTTAVRLQPRHPACLRDTAEKDAGLPRTRLLARVPPTLYLFLATVVQ